MNRPLSILVSCLKWFALTILAFLILYFGLLLFFNFNWLKGPLERRVLERTGRELHIEGNLSLRPGWPLPRVRAEKVSFSNPDWAREKQMFTVDQAEIALSLPHLLLRKIHLSEVLVAKPVVALEIAKDGRRTWLLDQEQRDQESSIGIGKLKIDEGQLNFYNSQENIDLLANFSLSGQGAPDRRQLPSWLSWLSWKKTMNAQQAKGDADAEDDPGVTLSVKGKFRGTPVDLKGEGGSVFSIRDENYAYPLKISGKIGDAGVSIDGTVNGLTTFAAMDVKVAAQGRNLGALKPLLGVTLPDTKPYATAGRVRHKDDLWHYEDFTAKVGGSDLAGNVNVRRAGKGRTAINGDFASSKLQLADFPGTSGKPPVQAAKSEGLLPKTKFDTAAWDTLDADIRLRAAAIEAGKLPLRNLNVHASLKDKVAKLEDLNANVAGGQVSGKLSLDGNRSPARGQAELQIQRMEFTQFMPDTARAATTKRIKPGLLNANAKLSGTGDSVDALLSGADGHLSMVLDGGEISRFIVAAVGIDIWNMLRIKMQGDSNIPIRCGVADFGVKQGIAQANFVVLDTEPTRINVDGNIDLKQETLDLTLLPEPKRMSPLSLRSPIYLRGPLNQPRVSLDKKSLVARSLGALALGVVSPLLALAPLIETGPGQDSNCGALIQDARANLEKDGKTAAVQADAAPKQEGVGARSR